MEIITSNPIVYNNKIQLDTSLGEDLSGYNENLNYMEGRISDFDGSNEDDDIYYTCDNKTYHKFDGADLYVGFDGEYYNAKGEKVKGFFQKIGQGFKAIGKGVVSGAKKVIAKIKANKGARQLRRSNRKSRRKDRREDRKENRAERLYEKKLAKAEKKLMDNIPKKVMMVKKL